MPHIQMLLALIWPFKVYIIIILLIILCVFQTDRLNSSKEAFKDKIEQIENENIKQKAILIEKVGTLEQNISKELSINSEIKKEKDIEINNLNGTISDNSSRLQQLAKQAIEADKRQCSGTVTTKIVERIVEVPTAGKPSKVTTEILREIPKVEILKDSNSQIILDMASDFENLSATCATNYEKLKNEAIELEGWSNSIIKNTEIK